MRHISNKFDWLYEFKPYTILAIGLAGMVCKVVLNLHGFFDFLAFFSATTLLGTGIYILKARIDYRKKSIMTM